MNGAADAVTREVTVVNRKGLHARASAMVVAKVAEMPGSEVLVAKDGQSAAGNSILDLMMLGAARGHVVQISVAGAEREARLAELVALFEAGFGED